MNSITMDMIFIQSDDVVARVIDGSLIIVPLTAGIGDMEDDLFSMNETGTAIWNLLDGRKTLKDVVAALKKHYQAEPEEIEQDTAGIVEELLKRKMIVSISTAG